jgi:hypothetical protein
VGGQRVDLVALLQEGLLSADLVNSFEAQARSSGKLASPSQFRRNA